ncbi:MAG: ABC transporter substrate-binding protein [Vicinamibacterales bacterium]
MLSAAAMAAAADPAKVLRIASDDIVSLDPQQPGDIASTRIAVNLFEALYRYGYFAEPAVPLPDAAAALPTVTDDGRTWKIPLRRGILFVDDPAFHGQPRELVAADYVYALERAMDPHLRSGGDAALVALIDGARAWVNAARAPSARTDYDHPPDGLQAPDRHTLVIHLTHADYTLPDRLTSLETMAVAREVVEASGADILHHPVGTGPYRLVSWRPSSQLVLEANPRYASFAFPEGGNAHEQAIAHPMAGVKLPQIGRVEVAIIEEAKARLLAFERGDLDYLALAGDDAAAVIDHGALAPARGAVLILSCFPINLSNT